MTEDYKEILADGARDALRRSPLAVILIVSGMAIVYVFWQLLSGNVAERADLRAQNAELTRQLVECYRTRPAGAYRQNTAVASAQSDDRK